MRCGGVQAQCANYSSSPDNNKPIRALKFRPHSTLMTVLAITCLWIQDTAGMNDEINNSQDMQTAVELLFQAYSESYTEARGDLLNRALMDEFRFWTRSGVLN